MANKATYDPVLKTITLDQILPVDGLVEMDVREDFYSDAKDQWLNDSYLNQFEFPFFSTGGDPLPECAVTPRIYFLVKDWRIVPDTSDHALIIATNLFSEDGAGMFSLAPGSYEVAITVVNTISDDDRIQQIIDILLGGELTQRMRDALSITVNECNPSTNSGIIIPNIGSPNEEAREFTTPDGTISLGFYYQPTTDPEPFVKVAITDRGKRVVIFDEDQAYIFKTLEADKKTDTYYLRITGEKTPLAVGTYEIQFLVNQTTTVVKYMTVIDSPFASGDNSDFIPSFVDT